MFHDIVNAYSANFQRDNQICSYHNVELRLPFVDFSVIDFVLRLPLHFKINSNNDQIRKHILRKIAHNLDIPKKIADKPKKAQKTPNIFQVLMQSVYITTHSLARHSLENADIVIEPTTADISASEFVRTPELITLGEMAAAAAVPEIKRKL